MEYRNSHSSRQQTETTYSTFLLILRFIISKTLALSSCPPFLCLEHLLEKSTCNHTCLLMSTCEVISGNDTLPLHSASSFSRALITYSISSFRIIHHIWRNATKAVSFFFFYTTCRFFLSFTATSVCFQGWLVNKLSLSCVHVDTKLLNVILAWLKHSEIQQTLTLQHLFCFGLSSCYLLWQPSALGFLCCCFRLFHVL